MLREAAFIGVPAYSIFRSAIGEVDRFLERSGKIAFLENTHDFSKVVFSKRRRDMFQENSTKIVADIDRIMTNIVSAGLSQAAGPTDAD